MSSPPRTYRVYSFDARCKMLNVDTIESASDEDAVAQITQAGFGSKCEIWDGRRLVAQLPEQPRA